MALFRRAGRVLSHEVRRVTMLPTLLRDGLDAGYYRGLALLALTGTLVLLLLPGAAVDVLKELLGLDPSSGLPSGLLGWDKLVHFVMFAACGFFLARGWPALGVWQLLLALVALGALTELLQYLWVPGRHGLWADVVADALGAATGLWLARRRHRARTASTA